jgi:predicted enzyme related to lactoylglutathione lyase
MPRVVHFEIHAAEPERVAEFYRQLFGWEIVSWAGPVEYRLITTGPPDQPGIDGGMVVRRGPPPAEGQAVNAYVCTIDVESVDDVVSRAGSLGGSLAVAKMAIPGVGWLAYLKDPDGNIFGVMQNAPGAA